jgi:hypothetical protein
MQARPWRGKVFWFFFSKKNRFLPPQSRQAIAEKKLKLKVVFCRRNITMPVQMSGFIRRGGF